jgi:hypothetical protein
MLSLSFYYFSPSRLQTRIHSFLFTPHHSLMFSFARSQVQAIQMLAGLRARSAQRFSSRNLTVRKRIPMLPPQSPSFDSNNNNDPCHQERNQAHRDREDEHCV